MGSTDLMAGMTTIAAGASMTVGDTTLTCDGTEDCVLTVAEDSVTGGFSATSTGGTVTVAIAVAEPPPPPPTVYTVDLMGSTDLMPATRTIAPGETVKVGDTTVTCPTGGAACVLTVAQDALTGQLVASSTGAQAEVAYTAPEPPPTPMAFGLPEDHELIASDEALVIKAGDTVTIGRTTVTCPDGGEACTLYVSEQAVTGNIVASYLGAVPTVTVTPIPPMIMPSACPRSILSWQAKRSRSRPARTVLRWAGWRSPAPKDCVVTIAEDEDGESRWLRPPA